MSNKLWWFAFDSQEFVSETVRLTAEQCGGYTRMKADFHLNGPLPNDNATLMRITGISAKSWRAAGPILRSYFYEGDDGLLHHQGIERDLEKARLNKLSAAERGRKGAEKRWLSNGSANGLANSSANGQPLAGPVAATMLENRPLPLPPPLEEKKERKPNAGSAPAQPAGASLTVGFLQLPLTRPKGSSFAVTDALIAELAPLYPAVDLRQQFLKMRGWLLANPTKLKTKDGIRKFIHHWLSREQDRGGSIGNNNRTAQTHGSGSNGEGGAVARVQRGQDRWDRSTERLGLEDADATHETNAGLLPAPGIR